MGRSVKGLIDPNFLFSISILQISQVRYPLLNEKFLCAGRCCCTSTPDMCVCMCRLSNWRWIGGISFQRDSVHALDHSPYTSDE